MCGGAIHIVRVENVYLKIDRMHHRALHFIDCFFRWFNLK